MSEATFYSPTETSIPDPWSEHGYSRWQNDAKAARKAWMRMMGLSEEEIEEHCIDSPPTSLDEELAQYNAMFAIQEMNASS